MTVRRPPRDCPVCASRLVLTGLGCAECGTQLSGSFTSCEFCALDQADRELLRVFLGSRGNLREVERHLQVSYPTARARFDALLGRLGLSTARPRRTRAELLEALAEGAVDVDSAMAELADIDAAEREGA